MIFFSDKVAEVFHLTSETNVSDHTGTYAKKGTRLIDQYTH